MIYTFNDFLGPLFLGWFFVLVFHLVFNGLLSIFSHNFTDDDKIKIKITTSNTPKKSNA